MIYKFFDTLHTFGNVMFENYTLLMRDMFDRLISMFALFDGFDGIDQTNRMKIDAAMSHFAIFLMMTPKCSELLSVKMRPITEASRYLSSIFRAELNTYENNLKTIQSSIFVRQRRDNTEQTQVTLFDLEEMLEKGSKNDEVAQAILDNTVNVRPFILPPGGLMSEKTLFNTMQFSVGVCGALSISPDSMIQVVNERFEKSKRDEFHYLSFLNDIFIEFDNFCSKKGRVIICDFSQLCSSNAPEFILPTIEEHSAPSQSQSQSRQSQPKPQPLQQPQNSKFNEIIQFKP
jgi:hypothetical protein